MHDFSSQNDLFFHKISLCEVDATGYVPVARLLEWCHLAWEKKYTNDGWHGLFSLNSGFPVVSIEGSLGLCLQLGDDIFIEVSCSEISKRSVTFSYYFHVENGEKFILQMVHVYIEKGISSSIPGEWKKLFKKKSSLF